MSVCDLGKMSVLCRTESDYSVTGSTWNIHLEAPQVPGAARCLLGAGYFIEDVTAMDVAEGFEVIYHFDHWKKPGRVTLRTIVPHDDPRLPSIAGIYQGAEWHERECFDFYGIVFEGNPNFKPLLLPEDMDIHPLIKDEKKRKSAYELFPEYRLADCRPVLLGDLPEEPEESEAGK